MKEELKALSAFFLNIFLGLTEAVSYNCINVNKHYLYSLEIENHILKYTSSFLGHWVVQKHLIELW